jgi:hypothetical protein
MNLSPSSGTMLKFGHPAPRFLRSGLPKAHLFFALCFGNSVPPLKLAAPRQRCSNWTRILPLEQFNLRFRISDLRWAFVQFQNSLLSWLLSVDAPRVHQYSACPSVTRFSRQRRTFIGNSLKKKHRISKNAAWSIF